jgi:AcrR family transcriptional regulator
MCAPLAAASQAASYSCPSSPIFRDHPRTCAGGAVRGDLLAHRLLVTERRRLAPDTPCRCHGGDAVKTRVHHRCRISHFTPTAEVRLAGTRERPAQVADAVRRPSVMRLTLVAAPLPLLTGSNNRLKRSFVNARANGETKERLIAAASTLFAARGFHATPVRDIAAHARVNLAAGNYHYGSKKALYLEVLRAQFAAVRSLLARRGATRPAAQLRQLPRAALAALVQARTRAMLELLIGPPPGLHGTLMQREMVDPSEALPVIVDEFIAPMVHEMEEIVALLVPGLPRQAVQRCVFSIMGQVLFYRFTMPATLRMWGVRAYPRGLSQELAAHITAFSLGGLERLGKRTRRRRHAR